MLEAGIKGQHTSIRDTGNDRPDRGDRMEECCR